jgi:hypothetical protein
MNLDAPVKSYRFQALETARKIKDEQYEIRKKSIEKRMKALANSSTPKTSFFNLLNN